MHVALFFFIIIQHTPPKMNSSILSQVARPAFSATTKRSVVRTYFATPSTHFFNEEPKAHHQVAPLTESTIYAPQGQTSSTTETASENVIFSPTVNHVFDD